MSFLAAARPNEGDRRSVAQMIDNRAGRRYKPGVTQDQEPFGAWITAARAAKNLSLQELAALNKRTVREIEQGKRPKPSQLTRERLKLAFEASGDSGPDEGNASDLAVAAEAYGEWLRAERSAKKQTREELAKKSGLGQRSP